MLLNLPDKKLRHCGLDSGLVISLELFTSKLLEIIINVLLRPVEVWRAFPVQEEKVTCTSEELFLTKRCVVKIRL